jgi:O-antigen/teichoic acid export membrane protein
MSDSPYKNLVRGAAWTAAMRWAMRSIGFINIVILARLLTPQDFGIVAMASVIIGFINSFSNIGAHQLIIRERDPTVDFINTGWTVQVMQGVLVAGLVLIFGPFAAGYFDDNRVESISRFLALSAFIAGWGNIGLTLARKELDFALGFRALVYGRLLSFLVTLVLVLVLRDYWALVYGQIASSVIAVIISFRMHPWRPVLCLASIGSFLRYGRSIVPLSIAAYCLGKTQIIIAGGIASAAVLGLFKMASDLTEMLTNELAAPLGRGLMPGYSKLAHDPHRLASVFAVVLNTSSTIIMPLGIGFALVAEDIVVLVLGNQWMETVKYIPWLSASTVLAAVNRLMSSQILIVSGHESRSAILAWVMLLILVPSMIVAGNLAGVYGLAVASPFAALLFFPIVVVVLSRSIPISVVNILAVLARPTVSVLMMVAAVTVFRASTDIGSWLLLLFSVVLGVFTYCASLCTLWFIFGKPEGIERFLISRLGLSTDFAPTK